MDPDRSTVLMTASLLGGLFITCLALAAASMP